MVIADTSIWIDHFRRSNLELRDLLNQGLIMTHPLVIGELACGTLMNRSEIMNLLHRLPTAIEATHSEVLRFIENHHIMGKGLGYIDLSLLASSALMGLPIWTYDKALVNIADALGQAFKRLESD
jgi:predicted nucleic acid-binding protein